MGSSNNAHLPFYTVVRSEMLSSIKRGQRRTGTQGLFYLSPLPPQKIALSVLSSTRIYSKAQPSP